MNVRICTFFTNGILQYSTTTHFYDWLLTYIQAIYINQMVVKGSIKGEGL